MFTTNRRCPHTFCCLQCEVDDVFNPDVRVGLRGRLDRVFPERKLPQLALEGERRGIRGAEREDVAPLLVGVAKTRPGVDAREPVFERGARVMVGLKAGGGAKEGVDRRVGGLFGLSI